MAEKTQNYLKILGKIAGSKVLVVGDIMLDRFVYGTVDRISPESPVPVLSISRENMMLGGAGNTLSNLFHLGCKGKLLSVVGDDETGQKIVELAKDQDIDLEGLILSKDRASIVKTRFLAGHQQLLRTDYERPIPITQEMEKELLGRAKSLLQEVDVMILSDYGKGLLTNDFLKNLINMAKKHKVLVLVDPKGLDYSIYAGTDIVTPNKKELSEATGGLAVSTDNEVVDAAQKLLKTSKIKSVVATRSGDGITVVEGQLVEHVRSASDIEVFDVSGAGDTVIATIAAALAAGASLVEAASLANIAGSIVVAKVGTAPIRFQELYDAVNDRPNFRNTIVPDSQSFESSWYVMQENIMRWKARGFKIGFTNGCFDILHHGHVSYLSEARQKCDKLIVGLNHDASVKILKGPDRPVNDEKSRYSVLSALACVDGVVMFGAKTQGDDNTASRILELLQPDIYFKGGDYTIDEIPEAKTVINNGGVVELITEQKGYSTTETLKKAMG